MTDKIIELLKASGADAWTVKDIKTESWEFYFIKHQLDQNRALDVEHIFVEVLKKYDDGQSIGVASQEIDPTATEEEVKKIIDNLCERTAYAKNPYYELNKKTAEGVEANFDPEQMARDYIEAFQQIPETSTEFINSYEIFVKNIRRRFVNSEGIDVTVCFPNSTIECVVNAKNDEHEIELYRLFDAGACDKEVLIKKISDTLKYGKDRLCTQPTPNMGTGAMLIPTDDAVQIYRWISLHMHAALKYQQMSDWELGKPICDDVKGDTITMKTLKFLPNSSRNNPVDSEGAPVREMYLIKDGIAENYWGDCQFSYYLGVKDSFIAGNFEVEGGKKTEAEVRTGTYIEPVEFSDFRIDNYTGDFAGEIRLAYYHDGDKVTPVSGGSISGRLANLLGGIELSSEQRQTDNMLIPRVIKVDNVTISGAE